MERDILLAGLILAAAATAARADGALRVKCFDDAEGAEVFVNDEFKSNCPASVFVPAGEVRLRVRKKVDEEHERVFSQQLRVGEGAIATVEVKLSAPQLDAAAAKRKQAAEAQQALSRAQSGDAAAMREMSDRYRNGAGVPADAQAAAKWAQKAEEAAAAKSLREAEAGNVAAMEALAARYESGSGVAKDPAKAEMWRKKRQAVMQDKAAHDKDAARRSRIAYLESQRFFNTKDYFDKMFMRKQNDNPLSATLLTFYCPLFVPLSLVTDLSQLPGQNAQIEALRREASVLPAGWAAPDSMVARWARREGALGTDGTR